MAATASILPASTPPNLRPFDAARDLSPVADLLELSFGEKLDPDGQRYLREMRKAARSPGVVRWATSAVERVTSLSGYVWEEAGRVVGNLSLIPFTAQGKRINLIANVAVHPDYRRQGIARAMTNAALEYLQRRRMQAAWLQVREDTPEAVHLYRSLGFREHTRRTAWIAHPETPINFPAPSVAALPRQSYDWPQQRERLLQTYPADVTWHLPFKLNTLRPGFFGWLARFFGEVSAQHWTAYHQDEWLGTVTWQGSSAYADRLWLAASPEQEELAILALMPKVRQVRQAQRPPFSRRPLNLNYPAGRAASALEATGFTPRRTLIWMSIKLR